MGALGFSIADQAQAIKAACTRFNVPVQVFMGMYNNETRLGSNVSNSSAGAVGPFQFTAADKQTGVTYPMTNNPTLSDFQQQCMAAAAYLAKLYTQLGNSWQNALAGYNAGPGNLSAGQGYATQALAFQIPASWSAILGSAPSTPVAGGAFGAGGTGTPGNQTSLSMWTVGDASHPDQDYWTTINQYSQSAQWYTFSDGETLFVADGVQLMAQTPSDVIVRTDPRVVHAEATYDNTAFAYTSTHTKRAKVQRRTSLAKITSPTEVTVHIICNIDQFRAGDTVVLKLFGPADGVWLIGNCVRDVFLPYSELTLVQAMQPINAATGTQTGSPFLTGPGASVPGSSTVIAAMISEASTLANDNYPYVHHGGHIAAGSPDVGKPGPGFDGHTKGFDCSGAVYAVLAAGGLWPEGSPVNSDISLLGGKVVPGQGTGTPECTLFYSPNDHEFMRINGQFWGTGDGSGNGAPGNPNGGAGWLPNAVVAPRFQAYHFPQALLGQFTGATAVGPGGYINPFSRATGLVAERIDDGVDYAMSPGSPILAIGTVKVIEILSGWFAGQPLLLLQFLDGNKAGQYYYIAEQITGLPSVGTVVSAGSTLVTYASSGTGIEIGFGSPTSNSRTLAGQNGHGGMVPAPEGQQFSAFLVSLGAPGGH